MEKDISYKPLDEQSFEALFTSYFAPLCAYAMRFLKDLDSSKEIAHDVFINLWDRREHIDTNKSLKTYLFTSVHNRCLNYIRDNRKFDHSSHSIENASEMGYSDSDTNLSVIELQERIDKAINQLPQKCKEIFVLSRYQELKYSEIAVKLNISVKTVEAQITKALKTLREELSDYLPTLLVLCLLCVKSLVCQQLI